MKQFDLAEYLANPSKKVVTRDGKSVRIRCTDRKDADYPIVALIDSKGKEEILSYTKNGYFYYDGRKDVNDLFFAPEEHEGWINLFGDSLCGLYIGDLRIFESKENAEKKGKNNRDYVKSIKIKWEE